VDAIRTGTEIDVFVAVNDYANASVSQLFQILQVAPGTGDLIAQATPDANVGAIDHVDGFFYVDSSNKVQLHFTFNGMRLAAAVDTSSAATVQRFLIFSAHLSAAAPFNTAPVAAIGPLAAIHAGTPVTLDGSGSTDADGDILTYRWTLLPPVGSSAALNDATAPMPSFVADRPGDYLVTLVVNDGQVDSGPATATLSSLNGAPVANAGPGQLVTAVGSTVTLDGSASFDPDGDALTYTWTLANQPAGSAAVLSSPAAINPTFVADIHGDYTLSLDVRDPFGASSTGTVLVSFNNIAPVADAGPDQSVSTGSSVTLSGSGSDANGDAVSYSWSLLSTPSGSSAALAGGNSASPTFVAGVAGTYIAQLIVNDGFVDSAPDTVVIQASSATDAVTQTLQDLIALINGFPATENGKAVFQHRQLRRNLVREIQLALYLVEHGQFRLADRLLGRVVLAEMDGCQRNGKPDRGDWIRACAEQDQAYLLVTEAISYLDAISPGGVPAAQRRPRGHGGPQPPRR
jgi:hypothetical protein